MHTVPKSLYGMGKIVCESRGIIVISEFVKQKMKEKFQIPDEKFSVMYNCLRNYFFESNVTGTKEAIEKRLKETIGGRKVILFAGRLNKEKGIEEVISAVKQLNRKDIVLLIVGSNFYKASIVGTYEERLHEEFHPAGKAGFRSHSRNRCGQTAEAIPAQFGPSYRSPRRRCRTD